MVLAHRQMQYRLTKIVWTAEELIGRRLEKICNFLNGDNKSLNRPSINGVVSIGPPNLRYPGLVKFDVSSPDEGSEQNIRTENEQKCLDTLPNDHGFSSMNLGVLSSYLSLPPCIVEFSVDWIANTRRRRTIQNRSEELRL